MGLACLKRYVVKAGSLADPIGSLSGGNQQKVVLGRWEAEPAKVLLLDEPFQGVDVGARQDLIEAIRARSDCATLIATSDPEEAIEVADRVLVMDHHALRTPEAHRAEDPEPALDENR